MNNLDNVGKAMKGIGVDAFGIGVSTIEEGPVDSEDDEPEVITVDSMGIGDIVDDYYEDEEEIESDVSEVKDTTETPKDYKKVAEIMKKVLIILTVITVTIVLYNYFKIGSNGKKVNYSENVVIENPIVFAEADQLLGATSIVIDNIIADKSIIVNQYSVTPVIMGTANMGKIHVIIPVTLDEYNQIPDGAIVKVSYKILKINEQNYTTETKILEVI